MPRFVSADIAVMPDPEWKAEQGKKGGIKPAHPCIFVICAIDDEGRLWVYDDKIGFRQLSATDK